MLFHQGGEGLILVILTLWLQSVGIGALVRWARHAAQGDLHALTVFRSAGLVVRVVPIQLTRDNHVPQLSRQIASGHELHDTLGETLVQASTVSAIPTAGIGVSFVR